MSGNDSGSNLCSCGNDCHGGRAKCDLCLWYESLLNEGGLRRKLSYDEAIELMKRAFKRIENLEEKLLSPEDLIGLGAVGTGPPGKAIGGG